MAVYVICDDNNKYESLTKEEILSAIEQALEQGYVSDPEAAVFSKIKEINAGAATQMWVGTEAEYNALNLADMNASVVRMGADGTLYLCTDDSTLENVGGFKEDDILSIKNGGTGAVTALAALKNLGAMGITYFDGSEAVDMNNLTEFGVYFFQYATGKYTNLPPNNGGLNGWMLVLPDESSNAKQIWFRMGSEGNQHNTYVRTIYGYNGTISDWAKFMTSKDFTVSNGVLNINTL